MKKILVLLLALVLACTTGICLFACDQTEQTDQPVVPDNNNNFVNPGDKMGGGQDTGTVATAVDTSSIEEEIATAATVSTNDLANDIDATDATAIAETSDPVTIDESGSYILSGNYSGGIVIAKKEITVHLFLNNANISNNDGVAINGKEKKLTVIITAMNGTTNTITNNGDDVNAIHIKGALSVNGSGSLAVTSASKGCIKATKTVTLVGVNLQCTSAGNAISGESIVCQNCSVNIVKSGKDGMQAECDFDNDEGETYEFTTESGFITMTNVQYSCVSYGDGLQADTFVYINGGTYNIVTNGEFVAKTTANKETYDMVDDDFRYIKSGASYQKVASDYAGRSTLYGLTQSCKGIKVGEIEYDTDGDDVEDATITEGHYTILIQSGTFSVNSTDDALHTNCGYLLVKGGTLEIETSDDALTSDILTSVQGGNITVYSCYEGVEGGYVQISGGTVDITASDDGINAASDDTSIQEHIIISGGTVTVNATGDGIDSNGSLLISGGTITVYGPTSGADSGMDSETGIVITGGNLVVASTLQMVETPAKNSTQYVVSYAQQTSIAAETEISIQDANGETILTFTATKACQSIIFSSPNLQKDQTYTVVSNGTELASFTVTDIVTSIGVSTQSGMGGGMGGITKPEDMGGNQGGFDPGAMGGGTTPPDAPNGTRDRSGMQIPNGTVNS